MDKELRRALRRAAHHPSDRDIHEIRKSITKVRSWLRLVREETGQRHRKHNRRLRRAARALAPARDAGVIRAAFESVCNPADYPAVSRRLGRQERRAERAVASAMRDVKAWLKRESKRTGRLRLASITSIGLAAALDRTREEMRSAFEIARGAETTETLHVWRKRTKNHLHALALVRGADEAGCKASARVSRLLGNDHDLALLEQSLEEYCPEPEGRTLLRLVARRRRQLRRQYFRASRAVFPGAKGRKPRTKRGK